MQCQLVRVPMIASLNSSAPISINRELARGPTNHPVALRTGLRANSPGSCRSSVQRVAARCWVMVKLVGLSSSDPGTLVSCPWVIPRQG